MEAKKIRAADALNASEFWMKACIKLQKERDFFENKWIRCKRRTESMEKNIKTTLDVIEKLNSERENGRV